MNINKAAGKLKLAKKAVDPSQACKPNWKRILKLEPTVQPYWEMRGALAEEAFDLYVFKRMVNDLACSLEHDAGGSARSGGEPFYLPNLLTL